MDFARRAARLGWAALLAGSVVAAQDLPGSEDHPLLTRMPGYEIVGYEAQEFGAYEPTVIGGPEVRWEGRKVVIDYAISEGAQHASMLQIVRNYERALREVGGRTLGGDERRVAAAIAGGASEVGVYIEAFNEGRRYTLVIVEPEAMRQEVVASAAAMGREISSTGRTIVHGIHFDTGSARLRAESEPALLQMVELLQGTPGLAAYVVGHTDGVGAVENNLRLSNARAEAVIEVLAARGIPRSRLRAFGAGPFAPVASNRDEAGRAQNRRVELVAQ
jgi:OmpA-OmpF porin, OOP family